MTLDEWAADWQISAQAVADLRTRLGLFPTDPAAAPGESEAAIQTRIRLEASAKGCRLWRNNVGACYTAEGAFLRYGLANDSAAMNKKIKSADLVGIRPVKITPQHVGATVGQFVAREVKRAGWRYSGSPREEAQLAFISLVLAMGGDAAFSAGTGTL